MADRRNEFNRIKRIIPNILTEQRRRSNPIKLTIQSDRTKYLK